MSPTSHAVPELLQPPVLIKSLKTNEDELCGAIYTKGMRMAKNPTICSIMINTSIFGNSLAPIVFTSIQISNAAYKSSVPCHRSNT